MRIKEIISRMSLEEKAAFCAGKDFWHLNGMEQCGIPETMVTDGPHGLRKQPDSADHLGVNESVKAVCFPAGCAAACSFDPQLTRQIGSELGKLAQAENVSVVLGPAMNIKRSPLCGRNFEYYSEDPLLSSKMGCGAVQGIQEEYVGASPKHFLANNQEYYRMTSNSVVDEQTLREIYLASFEGMVKDAKPWTMMCSYNRINGVYASENKALLTEILRDEWGFDGYVMTDWGALADPVESLKAGLELGMPGPVADYAQEIAAAVREGRLEERILDRAVCRLLNCILNYLEHQKKNVVYDFENGHETARNIENESAVLLKNEDGILPLGETEHVVWIGEYVKKPRYQGGGSSHVNSYRVSSVWDAVGRLETVTYAQGFADQASAQEAERYIADAVKAAKAADKAVIFAGLPESYEMECLDRKSLDMPENQNRLIEAVAAVQPNTVVVLHNGSVVTMPWLDSVKAVLELYLGGEAAGLSAADLLYGKANPCGRLSETFPLRLEDTPTYPYFGVEKDEIHYAERRLVGYRHYETMKKKVLFPFGYGLSYTSFAYSNLTLDRTEMKDTEEVTARVDVTNTGTAAGKEVVQLYVGNVSADGIRPARELRAFDKIHLEPGETRTVTFRLGKRAFAEWNTTIHDWNIPEGTYQIQIGKNAAEILLERSVHITNEKRLPVHFHLHTPLGEMMAYPEARESLEERLGAVLAGFSAGEAEDGETGVLSKEMSQATISAMSLRSLISFGTGVKKEDMEMLLEEICQKINQN